MIDFLKKLFQPQRSGATAKERLRLVLLSDHLSLAPELVDALKADLYDVFERYFEYDAQQTEVTFEHREHEFAMLASVPIQKVREKPIRPLHVVETPPTAVVKPDGPPRPRRKRRRRSAAAKAAGAASQTSLTAAPLPATTAQG